MGSLTSPLVKEVGILMAWYLAISTPLIYFATKYLRRLKERDEKKASKIAYICITAPLLAPMLIGIFALMFFVVGYFLSKIIPEQPDSVVIPAMILGAAASVFLGVKAYVAIYRSYVNDLTKNKDGAI